MSIDLSGRHIGFALTGSHCTFSEVIPEIHRLRDAGAVVTPIISNTIANTDTRFGTTAFWQEQLQNASGERIISTIAEAEPLGPAKTFDALVIAPCTGNTLSKLANALTDNAVLMAAKAQMRNQRPLIIAISTNDGLGLNAANLAKLLVAKFLFFVPFGQDSPEQKPNSLVARMNLISDTCAQALQGDQLQPMLIERYKYQ
jgi:dipicolinate synthase subunit B